ncbi:MAG: NAD-dependent epimerase [Rhizobiales bacterium]|nr:NAD-dependent epimerase [Hyphomicrobiales bacterium]
MPEPRSPRSAPDGAGARILITGAAGFIGFHTARRLLDDGAQVFGVDNLNDYYDPGLKQARLALLARTEGFAFRRADIVDAPQLMDIVADFRPTAVIHLAAQPGVRHSLDNPSAYVSANLSGFLNILEACRHHPVKHLIYASSSSVYGANGKAPFSEHDRADHPVSLYAATKRANELMAHSYAHLFKVPSTGLRFFTVYGPWGRPDMAYYKFTRAICRGEPIELYNEGRMQRDFTYIDDVVEAIAALVDRPARPDPDFDANRPDPAIGAAPYRIYNVGNRNPVTLDRFVAAIEAALGRKALRRLLPMQPGDLPRTFADIHDLSAAIGFAPGTSIEDGVHRFVAWYCEYAGEPALNPAGPHRV